jgi:hypothetical protein
MLTYPRYLLPISSPPEDESRVGRDGSQVGGARRDLFETVTHGPHGDIGGIYTTFPWPASATRRGQTHSLDQPFAPASHSISGHIFS